MKSDQYFFVGQKAFIRKGEDILIVMVENKLDFPGGKIQEGEIDLPTSLKREVTEETGLTIRVGKPITTWIFQAPDDHKLSGKKIFLVGYECEYISGEVVLSDEHTTYRWVNKNNYHEVDDKSHYFLALKEYFYNVIENDKKHNARSESYGILYLGIVFGMIAGLLVSIVDRTFSHFGWKYELIVVLVFAFLAWKVNKLLESKLKKR